MPVPDYATVTPILDREPQNGDLGRDAAGIGYEWDGSQWCLMFDGESALAAADAQAAAETRDPSRMSENNGPEREWVTEIDPTLSPESGPIHEMHCTGPQPESEAEPEPS